MNTSTLEARKAGRAVIVGTLNVDHVWRVAALPRPGETILAETVQREWGGKGANQAVAAARQGAAVTMVGAVGDDADGRLYVEHLQRKGIDPAAVAKIPGVATGTAHVYVDPRGENLIVVDRGANGRLEPAHVAAALAELQRQDVVAVQLECSLEAAVEALRQASRRGARALLNASPVNPGFPWGEVDLDTVIVNQHECRACFGASGNELASKRDDQRLGLLRERRVRQILVTNGANPTLRIGMTEVQSVPAYPVDPVDTVGAGDTFAGVVAASLAAGAGWSETIRYANVAAALSTLTPGAQRGIPTRAQVRAAMRP